MKSPNITELLSKLVEIPSISSLEANQKDVLDSANYIAELFKELGLNSIVTSSKNKQGTLELLKEFNFPIDNKKN